MGGLRENLVLCVLQQNAVLQLTRQDPKQMTKLTKELKKRQPPSGQELWRKCVVGLLCPSLSTSHVLMSLVTAQDCQTYDI